MAPKEITITVESAGYWTQEVGIPPYAKITKDGGEIGFGEYRRGLNVAVFETTGEAIATGSFDTAYDPTAAEAFAEFIANLPAGRIVAIAVWGDAAGVSLPPPVGEALKTLGCLWGQHLYVSASWAAIAIKGSPPGSAVECLPPGEQPHQVAAVTRRFELQQMSPPQQQLRGSAGDSFGWSVAMDGDGCLVGADSAHLLDRPEAGCAYLFQLTDGRWQLQQKLQPPDLQRGDNFGCSVAMAGDWVAIGARYADAGDRPDVGCAYTFFLAGGYWQQGQKLQPPELERKDNFGGSVGMADGWLAIGADARDAGEKPDAGAVYVFALAGTIWELRQKLQPPELERRDNFGGSVAIANNWLLAAAVGADAPGKPDAGAVYVFELVGETWKQGQKFQPPELERGDGFGGSVAIAENWAAVGAPRSDAPEKPDAGAVYVFELVGGTWQQRQKLQPPELERGDNFGSATAARGELLLVGAFGADAPGKANAGCIYIYRLAAGCWQLEGKWQPEDLQGGDRFGYCAAIDAKIAIGGNWYRDLAYVLEAN